MNTSSTELSAHVHERVKPFILRDLKEHCNVTDLSLWIEAVLGLDKKKFDSWALKARQNDWFNDPVIQTELRAFYDSTQETMRYEPFCNIANRVLELAKGTLLPSRAKYPVEDFTFVRNDPFFIQTIDLHGLYGAKRKPDVVGIRSNQLESLQRSDRGATPTGLKWTSLLYFVEFKEHRCKIKPRGTRIKAVKPASLPPDSPSELHSKTQPKPQLKGRTKAQPKTKTKSGPALKPKLRPQRTARPRDDSKKSPGAQDETTQEDGSRVTRAKARKRLAEEMAEEEGTPGPPAKRRKTDSGDNSSDSSTKSSSQATDVHYQAASYALEVLSSTNGTRIHSLGSVIKRDLISFWYYDASGAITTDEKQSLSLVDDFEEVAAVLVAIACCDAARFGAMPGVTPPKGKKHPKHFPSPSLSGYTISMPLPHKRRARQPEMVVTLDKPLFCQYSIVGRHTIVYAATASVQVGRRKTNAVIVKISQQARGRRPEYDFLAAAHEAGVDHLPELHSARDLYNLSDGVRGVFMRKDPGYHKIFEDRVLRAIVYTEYIPLVQFLAESPHAPRYLQIMANQMVQCLYDLRYDAKILHRDISPNNIMVEMRNGEPFFILNDFDLATFVQENGKQVYPASSKHRTGTLPFMAVELLQAMEAPTKRKDVRVVLQVLHRLRHDWESLLWVTLWCMLTMDPDVSGTELQDKIVDLLSEWETGSFSSMANNKKEAFDVGSRVYNHIPPRFEGLIPWFQRWCNVLRQAEQVRQMQQQLPRSQLHLADRETLDGAITLEKLLDALQIVDDDEADSDASSSAVVSDDGVWEVIEW